jgi:hypothetical protein
LPNGEVAKLQNPMLHFSFMNFSQVLQKIDRYSTASAEQAYNKGIRSNPLKALLHGFWAFIRTYLIRAGFLDGYQGLALALSNAEGSYYRYIKIWHMQNQAKK